ncbi:MAG: leucine-rich repeat domain-containing protein [Candidatus Stygibacter australis]|nr:leucine-rich repeat domain-containing protein [Candidatus Stygibacter australis]
MTDIEIIKKISAEISFKLKEGDEERGYQLNESGNITGISLTNAGLKNLNKIIKYLKQLKSLTALDLSENNISDIEPLIELRNLTSLNLYDNNVIDLSVLKSFTDLREINLGLSYVKLQSIIHSSDGRTLLDGQEKSIRDLSPLQGLVKLKSLNLAGNQISDLSPLQGLVNLKSLKLWSNEISDLSPLQELVNLKSLDLRHNKVSDLSPLQGMVNLNSLNLESNQVSDLSPLQGLVNLNSLNLENNQVSDLSPLQGLVKLNSLNLESNQVSDLSPLQGLVKLNSLKLYNNQVSDLSPLQGLVNPKSLDLRNNQISDLSPLQGMVNLNSLKLWSNEISDLSPLQGLVNLNSLDLYKNEISNLSPLQGLVNLNSLDLERNKISNLSPLQGLVNLNSLNLENNQVSDLSPLQGLVKLNSLKLYNNQVSDLSPLQGLVSLNSLKLWSNQISDLSPLQGLVNLNSLDLRRNKIKKIEKWIIDFDMEIAFTDKHEGCINLYENPIENVPIDIIKGGKQSIIDYFNRIEEEGATEYLYESKLLIIGEGGVGKTSFAVKLQNADAKLPEEEDTTLGIDVGDWEFEFEDKVHGNVKRTFYVNLWDFGGQKIYRGTHQIFFCNKTFYVLIDDTRENKTDFTYWLNSAEQFAGESSFLLIIFNIKEEHAPVFDESGYKSRFSKLIKDIISVDLRNDHDAVIKMQKKVIDLLQELPGIGDPLPPSWIKIRKDLLDVKEKYISFDKFKEICQKYKITGESEIVTLSAYLNRIGVFTHFIEDDLLCDRIFLDSNWLVKKIYEVLDHKLIKERKGEIGDGDIKTIWKDESVIEKKKLTQLMHKFGLMYQVHRSNKYIVPAYLSEAMPYEEWEHSNKAGIRVFIYEFDKYMPDGLFPKIIVALHKYIKNQKYVWRRGVNLEYDRTYAEITETYEAVNRYKIRIWGVNKEGLLAIIREKIKEELEPYQKLNYKELIPCICSQCQGSGDPYYYKYSSLLNRKEKGKQTIECDKSFKDVRVDELLRIIVPVPDIIPEKTKEKREIKIFLASSNELNEERKELKILIYDENRKYKKQNISLEPVLWEDLKHNFQEKGYQNYLNKEMLKCDIVIIMFFTKVGEYTWEEFYESYISFQLNNNPGYVYVYFKDGYVKMSEIKEAMLKIPELKKTLQGEEQIYISYDTIPDLNLKIKKQLDLIIPEIIEED